ncbi:MAG: PAS domain-containing protein, partial [Rudaea sp.]
MKLPRLPLATRVAFLYIIIGSLWILLSDRLVASFFPDPQALTIAQTYKGWVFVALSGLVLLAYVGRENRLRQRSEQDLNDIFLNSADGIFEADSSGAWIRVNPAMAQLLGFSSPQQMLDGDPPVRWTDPPPQGWGQEFADRLFADGQVTGFEAQLHCRDDRLIWTSINARVVRDPSGKVVRVEGFVSDVTDRKAGEQALLDSEDRYRRLVDDSPYATAIARAGRLLYVNSACARLLGAPAPADLQKVPFVELLQSEAQDLVKERLAALDRQDAVEPFEARLVRRDGPCIVVEVSAFPITYMGQRGTQLFLRDLTAQKAAEDALRANEERLRAIVDNTRNVYYSLSPAHEFTYISTQV